MENKIEVTYQKTCDYCSYDILDENGNVMGHYCHDEEWID